MSELRALGSQMISLSAGGSRIKIGKIVPIIYWVGMVIIVVGGIMGVLSDISELASNPFSAQSLTLLFGQIASPIWEGLALIAGRVIIKRLYGNS